MSHGLTITIPGKLERDLSPNGRAHWAAKKNRKTPNISGQSGKIVRGNECSGGAQTPRSVAKHLEVFDMKKGTPFSPDEDDFLHRHVGTLTHREMGERLNRDEISVRNRCSRIGALVPGLRWSEDDVAVLVAWYAEHALNSGFDLDALAEKLGRHKSNVSRKARTLGLTDRQRLGFDELETFTRTINDDGSKTYRRIPKYKTDDERRAAASESRRKHLAEHGHPRGALGMHHSDETKQKIGELSRAAWTRMTDQQKRDRRERVVRTNLDRYGTANPGFVASDNPYSRGHRGYVDDIPGYFFRSGWEANYARYLNWLKANGEIQEWDYECERFVFHGVTRAPVTYTPDFRIVERNGGVVFHEVKGWMDGPSKSKLKRMAKFYPEVQIIVIDQQAYRAIAKWASVIPHWGEMPKTTKQREMEQPE